MSSLTNFRSEWPYPLAWDRSKQDSADILVLGGGMAGCWAAIAAARKGAKVILVEKGATISSGAAGSGSDHWEAAATNPCSGVTPAELTQAMISSNEGYNNGISHFIECCEGYDRLLDLEKMGAKIRDTDDEFKGAAFRDEKTKLLFAYDYVNRFTLRVWGTTFKPALYRECKRLGIKIYDRTMASGLLTADGKTGRRVIGATGFNVRTGEFLVVKAKTTVLCMSRPIRVWLFSPTLTGISEFRPPQCTGDGHAMSWRAGVEFTMMEKSLRAQWSGDRSFPPYGTGNTHNTWYACSLVDVEGKEIPWVDRDGHILKEVSQRYCPAPGQKFFLKGGGETEFMPYEFQGPDTLPLEELLKKGFKLPFYADLPGMPEHERKAIWGLMVGQEGKTKVPILKNYTEAGFDPDKHLLQSYGEGWASGAFSPNERQLFGLPGGIVNDWTLRTNLEGLYAVGDQLFASDCVGHAAATGYYAGRHAADYAQKASESIIDEHQVEGERNRVYAPIQRQQGIHWKELNAAVADLMRQYCGEIKTEKRLKLGLQQLEKISHHQAADLYARNPHELMRALEVQNILTNAQIILHACLARKASSKQLHFLRSDYSEMDPPEWHKFITVQQVNDAVILDEKPIDYYGDLEENYKAHNSEYLKGNAT